MIVCIDGPDCSGKSTQAALFTRWMAETFKHEVVTRHFPNYDSPTGRLIKEHLENRWRVLVAEQPGWFDHGQYVDAMVFQALQTVNRYELESELTRGLFLQDFVLDRYWTSGWVYGRADGLDSDWLLKIHENLPQPEVFFLLDLPDGEAEARMAIRAAPDRYERKRELQRRVRGLYRELWSMAPVKASAWVTIPAWGDVEHTQKLMREAFVAYTETRHEQGRN